MGIQTKKIGFVAEALKEKWAPPPLPPHSPSITSTLKCSPILTFICLGQLNLVLYGIWVVADDPISIIMGCLCWTFWVMLNKEKIWPFFAGQGRPFLSSLRALIYSSDQVSCTFIYFLPYSKKWFSWPLALWYWLVKWVWLVKCTPLRDSLHDFSAFCGVGGRDDEQNRQHNLNNNTPETSWN